MITCDYEAPIEDHDNNVYSIPGECENVAKHILYWPMEDQIGVEPYVAGAEESITMFVCSDHVAEEVHEAKMSMGPDEALFVIDIAKVTQIQ